MKRSRLKFTIGAMFIPVGLVTMAIGLGTNVIFKEYLFALGLVLAAAGFTEMEIAALWQHLEEKP